MTQIAKNQDERILAGVASGVARYLEVDASVIRLLFLLLSVVSGLGVIIYFTLALFLPSESEILESDDVEYFEHIVDGDLPEEKNSPKKNLKDIELIAPVNLLAYICIFIGLFVLQQKLEPWSLVENSLRVPLIITVLGLSLIVKSLHIMK